MMYGHCPTCGGDTEHFDDVVSKVIRCDRCWSVIP